MKMLLQRIKQDQRGLTLVELLAVVIILAIVGAIAFVSIGNVIENSKKDAHIANALQVIEAVKLAEASESIDWTSSVYATSGKTGGTIDTASQLTDPWNADNINYVMEVEKDTDSKYAVTSQASKCKLERASELELNQLGRELCN